MKVRATFYRNGTNPFTQIDVIFQPDRNGYYKEVEVPDDTDMEWLKKCAEEDCKEGYYLFSINEVGPAKQGTR